MAYIIGCSKCIWLEATKLTCTFLPAMELLQVLFTSEASLAFVDLRLLTWEIKNSQIGCCFFSHDLSFENGSVISSTNDAIQLQRKHCNNFSILIGCSYCTTVALSLSLVFSAYYNLPNSLFWPAKCLTVPKRVIIILPIYNNTPQNNMH